MAKGSAFEREICRKLTDWWNGKPDPDGDTRFWRTAGSGGRVTSRARKGKKSTVAHCGDIAGLDDDAALLTKYVALELKRGYREATLHHLLDKPHKAAEQTYEAWIKQAADSMHAAGAAHWAIIHRRDRREILVTVPRAIVDCVFDYPTLPLYGIGPGYQWMHVWVAVGDSVYETITCRLDAFLGRASPDRIRELSRAHAARPKSS